MSLFKSRMLALKMKRIGSKSKTEELSDPNLDPEAEVKTIMKKADQEGYRPLLGDSKIGHPDQAGEKGEAASQVFSTILVATSWERLA